MRTAIELSFRALLVLALAVAAGCGEEGGGGDDDPVETVDSGIVEDPRCNVDIVDPIDNDNCCPDGATASNDNDCAPVCGDGVIEGAEQCDDGNTTPGDGCDGSCQTEVPPVEATALRLTELNLREPHVFAFGFVDVTATVNGMINDAILQDLASPEDPETPDGLLDFSFIAVFRPYDPAAATNDMDIVVADCAAPLGSSDCVLGVGQTPVLSLATNGNGDCLDVLPGTDGGHSPGITTPDGPCFASDSETFDLLLGGIAIHLIDGQMAANYAGSDDDPQLTKGLMRGFLSIDAAAGAVIPDTVPLFGGMPIGDMLVATDKDTGPNGEDGWWFYMNYSAEKVSYSD